MLILSAYTVVGVFIYILYMFKTHYMCTLNTHRLEYTLYIKIQRLYKRPDFGKKKSRCFTKFIRLVFPTSLFACFLVLFSSSFASQRIHIRLCSQNIFGFLCNWAYTYMCVCVYDKLDKLVVVVVIMLQIRSVLFKNIVLSTVSSSHTHKQIQNQPACLARLEVLCVYHYSRCTITVHTAIIVYIQVNTQCVLIETHTQKQSLMKREQYLTENKCMAKRAMYDQERTNVRPGERMVQHCNKTIYRSFRPTLYRNSHNILVTYYDVQIW